MASQMVAKVTGIKEEGKVCILPTRGGDRISATIRFAANQWWAISKNIQQSKVSRGPEIQHSSGEKGAGIWSNRGNQ